MTSEGANSLDDERGNKEQKFASEETVSEPDSIQSAVLRWKGAKGRGEALHAALSVDDVEWVNADLVSQECGLCELVLTVSADSLNGLRRAVDDLLASVSAVEATLDEA